MLGLNNDFLLRDQGVSNALNTGDLPRHRWYFVKEGFSPKLVEQAIATDGVDRGDLLLDPFAGSGTAPLSAAMAGLRTIGYEVNPFLSFLAKSKLSQVNPERLRESSKTIQRGIAKPRPSSLEGFSTFAARNRWGRWLFNRGVLRTFEGGYQALTGVPQEHRSLLKLALINSAIECCNATRDGKCLRYRKDWRENRYDGTDLLEAFVAGADTLVEDLENTPLTNISASIVKGDARRLIRRSSKKFRLCVTSPPYLNSFDYSDVYRPELFLGKFVSTNKSLMRVRLDALRSHLQASWKQPKKSDFGALYKRCINEVLEAQDELWDERIPTMIQAYFEDMESILRALRKRALPNASAWFVVSTSAYAGVQVPVDLILADIGQRAGWHLREVGVLRYLRSSSQQMNGLASKDRPAVPLRESVVILDASPRN